MSLRATALGLAALALTPVALSGCETTAEESAKLQRSAKHVAVARTGLSIARASTQARVVGAAIVGGSEGKAVAVDVHNLSGHPLRSLPIAITVRGPSGSIVFRNNAPGLEAGLTTLALLPGHGEGVWVDDQIPAAGSPTSASAELGEAPRASGALPQISVSDLHASDEPSSPTTGTVHNRSAIAQSKLIVYVIATRDRKIVAAGRAIVPELGAGASAAFQVFLLGSPSGAQLQASAPPTTLG